RPYRSVGMTILEDREISYRIWRREAGSSTWTEIERKPQSPASNEGESFFDTLPAPGVTYDYQVVAYDPGTGLGYGEPAPIVQGSRQSAPDAPAITSLSSSSHPAGTWARTRTVQATWSATGDGALTYYWVINQESNTVPGDGSSSTAGTTLTPETLPGNGVYYLHVAAKDTSNRWSSVARLTLRADDSAPSVSDDMGSTVFSGVKNVRITATDAHSGVGGITYQVDGGPEITSDGTAVTVSLYPGNTQLRYRATDRAGNPSSWVARTVSGTTILAAVQGDNRYATAISASSRIYPGAMPAGPDGNRTVIIASGANWPDALAASGLAGAHRGPLLLTDPATLPAAVADRIKSLGANRAIIVGGTAAVSSTVQNAVGAAVGGTTRVSRIQGSNRYLTSD
ncbi:MAG: cell wall-binding repeat-containing protein, partial [Actinomycetota bacterium]|nr:cell wall-binding repeat-containing protein [Actinomycetota bacterium]